MKYIIYLLGISLLTQISFAQNQNTQEKPWWAKKTFYKDLENSYLKTFTAMGITQEEVRDKANVIVEKERETTIGKNIGADNAAFKASYRIVYEHFEQNKDNDYYIGYFLYQICYSYQCDFKSDIKPFMDEVVKRQKQNEKMKNSIYFQKCHNNYLGWGMLNVGYPLKIGTSLVGRHLGLVGIGYYFNIGVDIWFTPEEFDYYYDNICRLHYAVGIRFFPFNNIYISAGYGTMGMEWINSYNESNGVFGTTGGYQPSGIITSMGYDLLVGNMSKGVGFLLSMEIGAGYDVFIKKWRFPIANMKIGLGFGINNK
jgi:hypothetical protein